MALAVLVLVGAAAAGVIALGPVALPAAIALGILGALAAVPLTLWLSTKLLLVPAAIILEQITIRRAVPDDAEALTHLHLDCWDDAYAGLIDQRILDARRTSVPERIDRWQTILEQGEGPLVAEGTDGLVGFVSTGPGRDNDVDTGLELMALYVRAAWWGTGVGYALFREAIGDRAAYLWVLVTWGLHLRGKPAGGARKKPAKGARKPARS